MTANLPTPGRLALAFFFLGVSVGGLLIPNYAAAGARVLFRHDCSVGGEVWIPAFPEDKATEILTARFRDALSAIRPQAELTAEEVGSALTSFHKAFCVLERYGEPSIDQLADGKELRGLVRELVAIGRREGIGERKAGIAADLAIQIASSLSDDAQRAALRKEAIDAKLSLAVKSRDVATLGDFFDELFEEQIRYLVSQNADQKPNPYLALKAIEKAIGEISIDDLARVNHLRIQRALYSLTARFPEPERDAADCLGLARRSGTSRALLVGIGGYTEEKIPDLRGPVNDVELLRKALEIRGVEDKDIRMAVNITREQLISEMRALVSETNCGDSVLFHYSGHSNRGDARKSAARALKGWNVWLMPSDSTPEGKGALYAAELSQFVTALRNRGANVLMIIDTNFAAGLDLVDLQELATPQRRWTGRISAADDAVSGGAPDLGAITAVHDGAGDFAVLYSGDIQHFAFERKINIAEGESRVLGVFTYAVARALQTNEDPTVRELLLAVDQEYLAVDQEYLAELATTERPADEGRPIPVLDASAPDMRFFSGEHSIDEGKLDIEIYRPELTRGVRVVKSAEFEIVGRLSNPRKYANLTINLQPVEVDANGRFSAKMRLPPGRNELQFAAIDFDYVFHTSTIELELTDDLEQLASQGEKYALIMGNQDYVNESFKDLDTPHRDADAIGKVLRDRFGFKTSIQSPTGSVIDLTLLDATQRQIQSTMRLLRNRLREDSTLLVYYAGHGVYQEDINRAYWLPVDAEPDADYTWIKATDLTDTLKQFLARNILVVADSCYSGAMAKRDVPALKTLDEDRRKALLKAATRKSRVLISSGGTEPVLDAGGGEHSVFARAFITALEGMDKEIFSSQELYSQFIYPMVHGNEYQEPQHKELEQSGHEGGDVIFWRTTAEPTAAE